MSTAPKIVYCILMFKNETDADWGMVYDFMEAQCGKLTDAQWEEVEAVYNPYLNDSRY